MHRVMVTWDVLGPLGKQEASKVLYEGNNLKEARDAYLEATSGVEPAFGSLNQADGFAG